MAQEKLGVDWIGIEREYRAGTSLRVIGARFGVSPALISRRAHRNGWTVNLAEGVRRATFAKLAINAVNTESTEEMIDKASDIRAELIRVHQKRFSKLQQTADLLHARLDQYLAGQNPTAHSPGMANLTGEAASLPFIGQKESPANLLSQVTKITAQVTALERQSYSLDEPVDDSKFGKTPLLETVLADLFTRRSRLDATEVKPSNDGPDDDDDDDNVDDEAEANE